MLVFGLSIVIIVVLWYIRFRHERRRMYELAEQIPSPPDIMSLIRLFQYSFDAADAVFPLLKEYTKFGFENGGLLKMWAGPMLYICLSDRKDVEYILKNHLEKETLESLLKDFLGNASIIGPVSIWSRRRKFVVPAFTPRRLNAFFDVLVDNSENLVEKLVKDNRVETEKFSVFPYVAAYTLSSVSETTLGVKLNAQENPDIPFLKAVNEILHLMTRKILNVWLWPAWMYRLSWVYRRQKKCAEIFCSLTDKIIEERREALKDIDMDEYNNSAFGQTASKATSFLDHLIIASDEENKITNEELREEILVLLLAGTDTSSVAICNTLKLLGMYPHIQDRVYAELKTVLGDSKRRLERNDLQQLPYLHRVVKESLRVCPPVPFIGRRLYEEVHLPSGRTLPEGANMLFAIWGIHRDPNEWGPDCNSFDPDRFLDEDKSGLLMPFSLGPRNCVGYKYAMMVVKIALITILRRFRVVGEEAPNSVPDIDCTFNIMLRAKDGYQIVLKPR